MAAISYPTTGRDAYLTDPWEAPNGSKWTWGGDAKPRWTAWSEPPLTEIAWDDVTSKPAVLTATTASFTTAQETKLSGIATGATANSSDATLLARANHTGTQNVSTLTGTLSVANGGTGSTTASDARTALGLGALAEVTPGTNVATALAINADATGGIFRQGQALSATTITATTFAGYPNFSGGILLESNKLLIGQSVISMNSSTTLVWGPNAGYGNSDLRVRRSAAKTLMVDDNAGGSATLAITGNLTASGTVTASGAISGTTGTFSSNLTSTGYVAPSYLRLIGVSGSNEVRVYRSGNGVLTLYNAAENDFSRLQLGGTTSSFPSIKRNGTAINVRLADDSADAPLACSNFTASGTVTASGAVTIGGGTAITSSGATGAALVAAATPAAAKTTLGISTLKIASTQALTTASLVDVTGMSYSLEANCVYRLEGQIYYTSDTGGLLAGWVSSGFESGAAGNSRGFCIGPDGTVKSVVISPSVGNGLLVYQESAARTGRPVSFTLYFATGTSATTITLRAQKNAGTGGDTSILVPTWSRLEKIE